MDSVSCKLEIPENARTVALRFAIWLGDGTQDIFVGTRLMRELSRVEETSLVNRTEKTSLVDASVYNLTEKSGCINKFIATDAAFACRMLKK